MDVLKRCAHVNRFLVLLIRSLQCMAVTSECSHTCSYESNEMNGLESMSLIITIISLGNAFPTSPIEEANAPEVCARLCPCALVQTRPRGRASLCAPVRALRTLRCTGAALSSWA